MRRVDPAHRSLGRFFADEIAEPLGLEFYIRLPESIPDARLAPLEHPGLLRMLTGMPLPMVLGAMNRRSALHRSLAVNPGTGFPLDPERVYARELEVPSGGGVGTARAIAKAYGVFATGGAELGLRAETLDALAAPAVPPRRGSIDECLQGAVAFSLGFMKPTPGVAVRPSRGVRRSGRRRVAGLRGPAGRHRLRLRHEPDGHRSGR